VSIGQRFIRIVAALALILIGPAMVAFATYRASVQLDVALPVLEGDLTAVIDKLQRLPIDCRFGVDTPGRLTVRRFWGLRGGLDGANHSVGMAAFSIDSWSSWASRTGAPGTKGLRAIYWSWGDLSDYLGDVQINQSLCNGQEWREGEELKEEEQRSQAVVSAYREELERFRPKLAAAREIYERDRPVLEALAWSLGLLELIGLPLFVMVALKDLRAWRARRRSPGS
jgi:hypothetical protein